MRKPRSACSQARNFPVLCPWRQRDGRSAASSASLKARHHADAPEERYYALTYVRIGAVGERGRFLLQSRVGGINLARGTLVNCIFNMLIGRECRGGGN